MNSSKVLVALVALAGAPLFVGCAIEPEPEDIGVAEQAQLDPGQLIWRDIVLRFQDSASTPFATIYIFNRSIGGYATGAEYWYVNQSSLTQLGSTALSVTVTDHSTTTPPSDPGYASEQSFIQAVNPAGGWGTGWMTDPVSGGALYSGAGGQYLRLQTSLTSPSITNVTWYEVIANTARPANFTPSSTFSVATSVSVPPGYLGYDISQ